MAADQIRSANLDLNPAEKIAGPAALSGLALGLLAIAVLAALGAALASQSH